MPAPTTSHLVTLVINGTDRTSLLLRDSLYIRHSLSNLASVCDFQIKSSTSYTPLGWHQVSIAINGILVFGGFITNNDASTIGAGSTRQTNWQISCQDWSILLDRVVVKAQYTQAADNEIISDLFSTYLATEDFSYEVGVTNVKSDIDIAFDRISMRDALNQLADRCNAAWFITPGQVFYWAKKTGFGAATFNIDTDAPNNTTTFDVAYNSIRRQIDDSNIINRVSVVGGLTDSGAKQTDEFIADGLGDTFGPLSKDVNSMWSITFSNDVTTYNTYATNIGYEPQDKLAYEGGTYVALVNIQNRTVRIRTASGGVPNSGTTVTVTYYYGTPVETLVEHTGSQNYYNRIFEQKIYDDTLTSIQSATDFAQRTIDLYAYQRETVYFDTYKHGLLPGTLIQIQCSALSLTNTRTLEGLNYESNLAQNYADPDFTLLLESGDSLMQEGYGSNAVYIIQEVQIQPRVSAQNQFMMVARVTCGDRQHTIQDAIKRANGSSISAGNGKIRPQAQYGRLSGISNSLGEVISGRALFTDGGTARFSWSDFGGHTGVVVGLDDSEGSTYGVVNILAGGTVRAKLGHMDGLPDVGTITPSGWGLYTTNGYFSGNVVGGTISGAVGNIGGFVIQANQMYSNGGTIATGSVVNSSNPGVYMGTAGLFGYGTLGLTFAIYTDPARSPWFSSGTINNVVYEVYESAIIRTAADVFTDGGIQIDNSGIFGVNPLTGGVRIEMEDAALLLTEDGRSIAASGVSFMVDATTGNLWAESAFLAGTVFASDGSFTGTVSAAQVNGGTVTGAQISGGTITGGLVSGGTVSGALVSAGTVTGVSFTGNTITGNTITGGTVSGALVSGGTVSGALVSGGTVSTASGTVTLASGGVKLLTASSNDGGPAFVKWLHGTDVVATLGGYYAGGNITYSETIGEFGVTTGVKDTYVAGTATSTQFTQYSNMYILNLNGTQQITIDSTGVQVGTDFLPASNNTFKIGASGATFKELWLYDATSGVSRKLTVSGGALVIT